HVIWFIWPLAGWGIGLAFHAYFARQTEVINSVEMRVLQIEMYARSKERVKMNMMSDRWSSLKVH
ncbi:MAG: 2TM domain-containing protein, partial [Ignisphaera sp.]